MGLDIYLHRYDNFEDTREREKKYSEFSDNIWKKAGDYDSLEESKKEEIRKKEDEFAKSLNLDKWGSDKDSVEGIEIDHPDYPDHYFKIGYFRSSYNGAGIERILRNLGLPTLADIFDVKGEGYYIHPDWEKAKQKTQEVIDLLKKEGGYRVHSVSPNIFSPPDVHSEGEALEVFRKQIQRESEREGEKHNYSNKEGEFFLAEPLKVLAMIPGETKILAKMPCVYVVTESDNEWYIQALEIVKSTCEYVLQKENIDQYYLHWSG